MSLDLSKEDNEPVPECMQDMKSTPLQGQNLGGKFKQLGLIKGIRVVASGTFADLSKDENNKQLRPANNLHVGSNALWWLVLLHGGKWSEGNVKDTTVLVVGEKPGKAKVNKTNEWKIPLITYESLLNLIKRETTLTELCHTPRPEISAISERWGHSCGPPEIQQDQTAAKGVMFSNLKPVRKRKEIPKTPEHPVPNPGVENPILA
jgi:hypothetical protein